MLDVEGGLEALKRGIHPVLSGIHQVIFGRGGGSQLLLQRSKKSAPNSIQSHTLHNTQRNGHRRFSYHSHRLYHFPDRRLIVLSDVEAAGTV